MRRKCLKISGRPNDAVFNVIERTCRCLPRRFAPANEDCRDGILIARLDVGPAPARQTPRTASSVPRGPTLTLIKSTFLPGRFSRAATLARLGISRVARECMHVLL